MLNDPSGYGNHPEHAGGWTDERIKMVKKLWLEGLSATQIAVKMGGGLTRNGVIGKLRRLNVERPVHAKRRTVSGAAPRKGNSGTPGQPKAANIVHRIEGRQKAERARQQGKLASAGHVPFREGSLPDLDEGVDVTALIAFADRRIGHQCAWIPGDPLDGAQCCGKTAKAGSQWCPEHHARVYVERAEL